MIYCCFITDIIIIIQTDNTKQAIKRTNHGIIFITRTMT
jgi:hypothetical protein